MKSDTQLRADITAIHHRGYPAYKSLQGAYRFPGYILVIDHVQGDPFAAPSKLHIEVTGKAAGFPNDLYSTTQKRIALEDALTRRFGEQIARVSHKAYGSGKSGLISISRCGQEILERSAMELHPSAGDILTRIEVGFPANGRTINAPELIKILYDFLPECITKSLYYKSWNPKQLEQIAQLCENQTYIREQLKARSLAAFVANGAILPRATGISHRPKQGAVPFQSPESYQVIMDIPHGAPLPGMGIPRGITLIVGGGFHGKSTLLEALEKGVYNHIGGDGREYVLTDDTALKLRAEDSRYISNTDISLFINHLPGGGDTTSFSTEDASGSTSQAANVVEGIEAGAKVFLIDEDTSATNFMIRDELMQRVVVGEEEPITPFISRVRELYTQKGISTVIVAGSSGSFFHVADAIIQMKAYVPLDITAKAKAAAADFPAVHSDLPFFGTFTSSKLTDLDSQVASNDTVCQGDLSLTDFHGANLQDDMYCADVPPAVMQLATPRRIPKPSYALSGNDRPHVKVVAMDGIQINNTTTDLRYLEQLADTEQLAALAYLLTYSSSHYMDGRKDLTQIVNLLEAQMNQKGLSSFTDSSYLPTGLCRPRRQEIFACFNRCRELTFS
jgi:predicted ABC-class ATPase